jgi:hypothetical protein
MAVKGGAAVAMAGAAMAKGVAETDLLWAGGAKEEAGAPEVAVKGAVVAVVGVMEAEEKGKAGAMAMATLAVEAVGKEQEGGVRASAKVVAAMVVVAAASKVVVARAGAAAAREEAVRVAAATGREAAEPEVAAMAMEARAAAAKVAVGATAEVAKAAVERAPEVAEALEVAEMEEEAKAEKEEVARVEVVKVAKGAAGTVEAGKVAEVTEEEVTAMEVVAMVGPGEVVAALEWLGALAVESEVARAKLEGEDLEKVHPGKGVGEVGVMARV